MESFQGLNVNLATPLHLGRRLGHGNSSSTCQNRPHSLFKVDLLIGPRSCRRNRNGQDNQKCQR